MKHYELILFDLDGTLTEPGIGITNSVAYALQKLGIPVPERRELYKFIGPPLMDSLMKYYGLSEAGARQAISYYREYYAETGMMENRVYAGIEELLKALSQAGKRLCVATSKPEGFARTILEHFKLASYFEYIAGAELDGTRTKKDEVIAYALEQCALPMGGNALMVGDREYDILGAAKCGLDCVGVLFGYGRAEELQRAGAAYIVKTVEELAELLLDADADA